MGLTQLADHAEQRVILLVVVLQGQELDESREDLLEGHVLTVAEDHAAKAPGRIVLKTGHILVQAGLQTAEDRRVLLDNLSIGIGVLHQTTNGIGSVGLGLGVLLAETVEQQLEERGSELGARSAHAVDAFSKDADGGSTLEGLVAAGIAEDGLLEDLPQLGEALTQSSGEARHNVKTGVNDNPVELGGLLAGLGRLLLRTELDLAGVLLGDDIGDHLDDVVEGRLVGDQGRTAVAQVLSHVAVDVGDSSTSIEEVRYQSLQTVQKQSWFKEYDSGVDKSLFTSTSLCDSE